MNYIIKKTIKAYLPHILIYTAKNESNSAFVHFCCWWVVSLIGIVLYLEEYNNLIITEK